jgi:hypothetical protein
MLADVLYDLYSSVLERLFMRLIRGLRLLLMMFLGLLWRGYEFLGRPHARTKR